MVKVKNYRNTIVIYYSFRGHILRHNTGVRLSGENEFLESKGEIRKTVENHQYKNESIRRCKIQVEQAIIKIERDGLKPEVEYIKRQLADINEQGNKQLNHLLDYYNEFYLEKKSEFNNRKRPASLKDYTSFYNTIKDYEHERNKKLRLIDVDNKFISIYIDFLRERRPIDKGFLSRGGLADSTIKKRLDVLKSFFLWLKEEKDYDRYDKIKGYVRKRKIQKDPVKFDTISIKEIKDLYNYQFTNQTHVKVRDIWVFACLTGLRWSDLTTLDKSHIIDTNPKHVYIEKVARKTSEKFRVPLPPIAIELLRKYEYNFNVISNQKANSVLKDLLKETGFFNQDSNKVSDEVIKRRNNRLMDSQLINSGKEILESEYLVLKETLDEIRQEYDKVEWMFFAGFRPKYNIGVPILFNMVKSIAEELKLRTKSNVVVFYAIEKSSDGIYHVHMVLKGSSSVKQLFPDVLRYKFGKIAIQPMIKNFDDECQSECYKYFSKEYFVDEKVRIGIIKT